MKRVAIIGMDCRYPDAHGVQELWENIVSGRRAFRRIPDSRTSLEDYYDADPATPDKFYTRTAALIEGYEFDRARFRIAGSTYRTTDTTHWLALDVAAGALADAGFPGAEGLDRDTTGVVIGNSLTGEFSRANLMRLRWPYVRRVLTSHLEKLGWESDDIATFLAGVERTYKAPFPEVDEDTLAGGLSNTIAGRVCNYFDLRGGGYTVDGACSSSLLSVLTAAKAIEDGDLDVAVAGGVDLSIDPFEIVGFAKTGALARREMRLYDRDSNGFWPGEGCGMIVLMREEDALSRGITPYGYVAGWGISSDGHGGITRPEIPGYRLALERAYDRAGFPITSVPYFEGHGTGTPVGDRTELTAIGQELQEHGAPDRGAAIGSIKGQIGHTKAAAGIAGLIKAVQVTNRGVIPPTVGCVDPVDVFADAASPLRPVPVAERWPQDAPRRAGVTSMGFGGINTHVVIEGGDRPLDGADRLFPRRDDEVLLFEAADLAEFRQELERAVDYLAGASYGELTDLGATLARRRNGRRYRAAVVAANPEQAADRVRAVLRAATSEPDGLVEVAAGAYWGVAQERPVVGLLFPGQGVGAGHTASALSRFDEAAAALEQQAGLAGQDPTATEVTQPLTVLGSLAGLAVLDALGIRADRAAGHSLGELTALHWAEAMDAATLVELARYRGRTMAEHGEPGGMLRLSADEDRVRALVADDAVVAAVNAPSACVVSGTRAALDRTAENAAAAGIGAAPLPVSHAFHSPLVAAAAEPLAARVRELSLTAPRGHVVSTVTGTRLDPGHDLAALLRDQVTAPVRFHEAATELAAGCDLLIEVGPGSALTQLATAGGLGPVVGLDTGARDLASLHTVVAAAHVVGALGSVEPLYRGCLVRPVSWEPRRFFENPTESAPQVDDYTADLVDQGASRAAAQELGEVGAGERSGRSALTVLSELAAERAELPPEIVTAASRPLEDLHLSSITIGQILARASSELGVPVAATPPDVATATIGDLAAQLDALAGSDSAEEQRALHTLGDWIGTWVERDVPQAAPSARAVSPAHDPRPWSLWGGAEAGERLRDELEAHAPDGGVLLCPGDDDTDEAMFEVVQKAAIDLEPGTHLVLSGGGAAAVALLKTFQLERPDTRVTVVRSDGDLPAGALVAEVSATERFSEARYVRGTRTVPMIRPVALDGDASAALDSSDVILAPGGGKGITAECVHALAVETGARVVLMGRSPADDDEVVKNLDRMRGAGVGAHYVRCDVADADAVRAAVDEISAQIGAVTAVVYGAGANSPAPLSRLTWQDVTDTRTPKVGGLQAVLDAVSPGALRLLATFGSVIGRFGLAGEAHYAMANAELAQVTASYGADNPDCRAVCLDWTVWADVGMGARLSVVESLAAQGIAPIPPEVGVAVFLGAVGAASVPEHVVVCGRMDLPTARFEQRELPLGRYLDTVLTHYRHHELVVETTLSSATDLCLADHVLDGNALLPAVFGLEAISQVACALRETDRLPALRDVVFRSPIVVPPDDRLRVRVAAVARRDNQVEVAVYSETTDFGVPHFTALADFAADPVTDTVPVPPATGEVALDPGRELYGELLFQGRRFHRLVRYDHLSSTRVQAQVRVADEGPWFAAYLPGSLLTGDPAARDALLHGNQVCVPDSTLLPEGVDAIELYSSQDEEVLTFVSVEVAHEGDQHVYDIDVRTDAGVVVERWRGLRLRAVGRTVHDRWPAALIGPHLERVLEDAGVGARISSELAADGTLRLEAAGPGVSVRVADDRRDPREWAGELLGDADVVATGGERRGVTTYESAGATVFCFAPPLIDSDARPGIAVLVAPRPTTEAV
ncbi:type I polyketide synthase [Myceligenerans salitolerans]|uniref:SDR family NAD(P)-dependent oxidoreductase n=1 Tax=Myceligenerans salitolerans TaxID=1230528 RepID=A0ABS3IDV3_9MICO|nr:type I polyketide synthase [Myceligenerans salitolerans]MBO0611226.1 SDR family NAD(P)-dependent oxidoreductase [Myceligenerans salitolerans]